MPLSDKFMENYRSCCSNSKTRLKVKAVAQDKCLDFNADRLDAEDWQPLIKALKTDRRLHTLVIKSEYPGKQWRCSTERVKPAFHRPNIMKELVESIVACMKRSTILSTVQLQSLPLTAANIEMLANGVRECESLQNLLLTNFSLTDDGLEVLYDSICPHIGLNTIDLSGCGLTARGAQIIAKIIRTQRLARYDETWKQSLRYREPDQEVFPGIRRITLNNNPEIGDDGFVAIVHELMDDLWVKAVDAQNCGLTMISGNEAMELVKINDTITVLDLTRNEKVTGHVKRMIKELLVEKEHKETRKAIGGEGGKCGPHGDQQIYDWLEGSSKLTYTRGSGTSRKLKSEFSMPPFDDNNLLLEKNDGNVNSQLTVELHQTKRVLDDTKRYLVKEREKREEVENEKRAQKMKLAEKFTKEWKKRKQIERERDRLKEELHGFLSEGHIPKTKSTKSLSTQSTRSKKSKNKKPKAKSKVDDSFDKPNRIVKHTSIKSTRTPGKNARSAEKTKRQGVEKYEISNTQQVQLMQKNLDKLNFNVSAPPQVSDTESEFSYIGYNQNTIYKVENNDVPKNTNEHVPMNNAAQKKPRDLSPISRSQWIFNEIMIGKSRKQREMENNFTSCLGNEKNDKCFRFDTNAKWEVKV